MHCWHSLHVKMFRFSILYRTVPSLGSAGEVFHRLLSARASCCCASCADIAGVGATLCLCSVIVPSSVCGLPGLQADTFNGVTGVHALPDLPMLTAIRQSASKDVWRVSLGWRCHSKFKMDTACVSSPVVYGAWWWEGCCAIGYAEHAADMCSITSAID
jgi:hypothetical protein